ncbi:MAG: NRDE family protein [Phycisphaerales bacterium JB063]
MACSRDERHGRAAALPPQLRHADNGRAYLLPVDPVSGGTWVAVSDTGLALTLLNYNPKDPPTDRGVSRGGVVTTLARCATLDEAIEGCRAIHADEMMPFRLVLCDGQRYAVWRSDEPADAIQSQPLTGPVMFTSSGLGDHLVEPPRRELFNTWFGSDPARFIDRQLAFHQHRWPDRPHLSVAMSREHARTVSYTTVDVTPDGITMRYHPDRPDLWAEDVEATLERKPATPVRP